jgi:hypothetical protein
MITTFLKAIVAAVLVVLITALSVSADTVEDYCPTKVIGPVRGNIIVGVLDETYVGSDLEGDESYINLKLGDSTKFQTTTRFTDRVEAVERTITKGKPVVVVAALLQKYSQHWQLCFVDYSLGSASEDDEGVEFDTLETICHRAEIKRGAVTGTYKGYVPPAEDGEPGLGIPSISIALADDNYARLVIKESDIKRYSKVPEGVQVKATYTTTRYPENKSCNFYDIATGITVVK